MVDEHHPYWAWATTLMIKNNFLNFSRQDAQAVVQTFLASLREIKNFIDNHFYNVAKTSTIFLPYAIDDSTDVPVTNGQSK